MNTLLAPEKPMFVSRDGKQTLEAMETFKEEHLGKSYNSIHPES
jgi:hypothetical protein